MAKGTIEFFDPKCLITCVDASWEFQDGGAVNNTRTRANELGMHGDEIRKKLHDNKASTSFVFVHKGTGEKYVWPKIGLHSGGWHVDGFSCRWDRTKCAAVLTVNCHKHNAGTMHTDCRTYTPSLANVPVVDFGCPSNFGDGFTLKADAVVDLRDVTYNVSATHIDELGRSGEELKGNNHDGVETLQVNLTGAATADDYTTSWDCPTDTTTPSNTGVTTTAVNLEHHIAADVAAGA